MLQKIHRSKVPYHKGIQSIDAFGATRLERVEAACRSKKYAFDADMLFLHFGVIPSTHIFRQVGCHMRWNNCQRYWYPECDEWGRTNHEGIFAAGDGTSVSGALTAQYKGELAALEVAKCFGLIPEYERDALARPLRKAMQWESHPRPFVDTLYAPTQSFLTFADSTVLCRCENVTVGKVRETVRQGAHDLNEVKILTRCGMGPCQGRMCGPGLAEVVAHTLQTTPDSVGHLSIPPP